MFMNFSHEFYIQCLVYIIGGIVFIAINSFKLGQMEARLATKEELKDKVKERDGKIDRVYQRFDEHKQYSENTFVRKDMCAQLHIASKDELKKLDDDYKGFRHEMRNQVQQIFDKIEQQNEKIDELKDLIIGKNRMA